MNKTKQISSNSKEKIYISFFLIGVFILDVYWMVNIPMEKAPDEEVRIILSDYISQNGYLPNAWEEAVRIHNWGFSYALRPMLINILGGFNLMIISRFTQDLWLQVFSVRIFSVFSAVALVYFCFRIGKYLRLKTCWIWLFASLCAFMPQVTFLAGYNNNDIFAAACTTSVIYCWIKGMKERWKWSNCFQLSIALGLTILSYYNAYPFVLLSIPIFFISILKKGMSSKEKQLVWKKTALIIFLTFMISGWWFIRNLVLYDGDLLGSTTRLLMGQKYAEPGLHPNEVFKLQKEGLPFLKTFSYDPGNGFPWYKMTFISSISWLGFMEYRLDDSIYEYCFYIFVTGYLFFFLRYVTLTIKCLKNDCLKRNKQEFLLDTAMILASVITILLSMYYSWTDDFQPQGRYIMPAFSSIILLMILGYNFLFKRISILLHKSKLSMFLQILFCLSLTSGVLFLQTLSLKDFLEKTIYMDKLPDTYLEYRNTYGPSFNEDITRYKNPLSKEAE